MKVAIVGTVGVPARYGGFETLAENLVRYYTASGDRVALTVFCSQLGDGDRPEQWEGARLRYVALPANGAQSVLYDGISLFQAAREADVILVLGVSGAIFLPLIRFFSCAKLIVNVDGIEWRRKKWGALARWFLRMSEWFAAKCAHVVVADNAAVQGYLHRAYRAGSVLIPYGGDHALLGRIGPVSEDIGNLDGGYFLGLCRIEPENNVHMILEGFRDLPTRRLVFVGNWKSSEYGRGLFNAYRDVANVVLLEAIYDATDLERLRLGASAYIHGHSAGGTNPALVEMMHFGLPVLAFDCEFNRHTTLNQAEYFVSEISLRDALESGLRKDQGADMRAIAISHYTWERIGTAYHRAFHAALGQVVNSCERLM